MNGNNKYKNKELKKPIKHFLLELWMKGFIKAKRRIRSM